MGTDTYVKFHAKLEAFEIYEKERLRGAVSETPSVKKRGLKSALTRTTRTLDKCDKGTRTATVTTCRALCPLIMDFD